jgi:hypothetical protein
MNIASEFQLRITYIVHQISTLCDEIVLYGSQVESKTLSHDIDLFVLAKNENRNVIFQGLATVQNRFDQIIHAVVINNEDLSVNQDIKALYKKGEVIFSRVS